ncbi:hypothetical protein KY290_013843 [Solanum tuberosum]|uniref:Uncharacterized protein n=1 Tax=Solanum tuberosum TaxID=4113 RepID=A0ABQ7VQN2_SOLTU|nr:hypothetical protein KY285_013412 [Solanum tuberosum]KAH0769862.1 hypothetical protein KY290_013843 [Solanum tuberosum]
MRSFTFFCLSMVMIAEILLSASSVTHGTMIVDRQWNGTGEMEGINWQVSLAGDVNHLTYPTLQTPPICNEKVYGNCIGDRKSVQRPCTEYNYCKHPG